MHQHVWRQVSACRACFISSPSLLWHAVPSLLILYLFLCLTASLPSLCKPPPAAVSSSKPFNYLIRSVSALLPTLKRGILVKAVIVVRYGPWGKLKKYTDAYLVIEGTWFVFILTWVLNRLLQSGRYSLFSERQSLLNLVYLLYSDLSNLFNPYPTSPLFFPP